MKKIKLTKGKAMILLGIIGFLVMMCITYADSTVPQEASLGFKDFLEAVKEDKVDYIVMTGYESFIDVTLKDGSTETVINPNDREFMRELLEEGIKIKVQSQTFDSFLFGLFALIPPVVFLIFVAHYIKKAGEMFKTKQLENNSNGEVVDVTFNQVAGMTEEKEELQFTIRSITDGEKLKKKGMRPVKGILLEGPPGVGKTLLAKAVAGEAGVPFYSISGSDFVEMFVGVGASRVRGLFKQARQNAPCIVFIDELDAVGKARGNGVSGNDEREQTLNQLLVEMDGFGSIEGVVMMAATNRADALDSALLRPGRFDKTIHIGPPKTKEDREAIVRVHLCGKTIKEGVTVEKIAKLCFGLTGAEIEAALNDAIMESFKDGAEGVLDLRHIDNAIMKLYSKGLAKGVHSEEELKRVAIHEIGHALMNEYLGRKVVKVSVQPYSSGVGGVTVVDGDTLGSQGVRSKGELIGDIKVLYAGMVAEKVMLGSTSNGCSNDLERATDILRNMVGSYGMVEGNLISLDYLAKHNPMITANNTFLNRMEQLGESIRLEVENYLSQEDIKERLEVLGGKLEESEVLYSLDMTPMSKEI